MAGLYKKEVLIREVSGVSVQGAIDWSKNWMNTTFQEVPENKDENGANIDFFFADIFDARDGNIYRVYTDACIPQYSMSNTEYTILDNSVLATKSEIPIVINDTVTISGNNATLTHTPIGGVIIGDEVRVAIQETAMQKSYVSVDYTISGKVITIDPDSSNEFNGKKLSVSYLYSE